MEKNNQAEFVSLVYASSKGSKNLMCIISGENNVERAKAWCNKLINESLVPKYVTLRVIETALNTLVSTASYLRYEANTKKRKHLNVDYFNL